MGETSDGWLALQGKDVRTANALHKIRARLQATHLNDNLICIFSSLITTFAALLNPAVAPPACVNACVFMDTYC